MVHYPQWGARHRELPRADGHGQCLRDVDAATGEPMQLLDDLGADLGGRKHRRHALEVVDEDLTNAVWLLRGARSGRTGSVSIRS